MAYYLLLVLLLVLSLVLSSSLLLFINCYPDLFFVSIIFCIIIGIIYLFM